LLDGLDAVERAARLREPFSAQLRANRAEMVALMREQCRATLAPELAACDGDARDRMVSAIATAASWEAWYHLRNDERLEAREAERVVRMLVGGVLGAGAAPRAAPAVRGLH
ncbi:MAG: hypothetical protein ACYDEN_14230, partial [Acidimicrobiales bacterium]